MEENTCKIHAPLREFTADNTWNLLCYVSAV